MAERKSDRENEPFFPLVEFYITIGKENLLLLFDKFWIDNSDEKALAC